MSPLQVSAAGIVFLEFQSAAAASGYPPSELQSYGRRYGVMPRKCTCARSSSATKLSRAGRGVGRASGGSPSHFPPFLCQKACPSLSRRGGEGEHPSIILSWTSAVLNPREDGAKYTLEFFALDADAALRASTSCGHADRTHRGHVSQLA